MSIDDQIANIQVAPIAQLASQGALDRQTRQMNNLEFLIKQVGYDELLKDVQLNDLTRQLNMGKARFDIEHQPERLTKDYNLENINKDFSFQEQLARDINTPAGYKKYADAKWLPPEFMDKDGNPLPFEATQKQRSALVRSAIDNMPHVRDKELAEIKAVFGGGPSGFTSDVNKFQENAGLDAALKWKRDNKAKIGRRDELKLATVIADLPTKIADRASRMSGQIVDETTVRDRLLKLASEHLIDNPENDSMGALNPGRLLVDDQTIDWDAFQQAVDKEFLSNQPAAKGGGRASVAVPAFMVDADGKKWSMEQLQAAAKNGGMTMDELIKEFKLTPGK